MAKGSNETASIHRLNQHIAGWGTAFTAFLGTALGIGADVVTSDPQDADFWPRVWILVGLLALCLVSLGASLWSWRRRDRLLTVRGTSYVVDSPLATWTPDEKNAYLREAEDQFAGIVSIPGPTGLSAWRWPHGEGAERWSDAVDDLVLSFRSVWTNDDNRTPNSVVCWASFATAIAWTARLGAADRNIPLAVRQRPSSGREGRIEIPDWNQEPHHFDPVPITQMKRTPCSVRAATVVLAPTATTGSGGTWPEEVRVLLIRATRQDWEGLTPDTGSDPVNLTISNGSGQSWGLGGPAQFHEGRWLVDPGQKHDWVTYPELVSDIADWIAATAHPTGLNFIGMLVPQEFGLGLGIHVAQRQQNQWPAHLWPIIKPARDIRLVVPGLDLGWESLHRTYLAGPR